MKHFCHSGDKACEEGYWYCGKCERASRASAYKNMTEAQKAYDRYVDPLCAYRTDFPQGCSCHISPPCNVCLNMTEEDLEKLND